MNETNYDPRFDSERFEPETALAIERLVDDEMSDVQQRELLAALDHVEGGWRRLALAYVEAQCLAGDFGSLLDSASVQQPERHEPSAFPLTTKLGHPLAIPSWWRTALAMAASFLLALGLGAWYRGTLGGPSTTPPGPSPVEVAHQFPPPPTVTQDAVTPPVLAKHSSAPTAAPQDGALTKLTSERRGAAVPLIPIGGGDSFDAVDHATGIPPQVVEALRRLGHRVEQRRGVLPVQLPDGRTAVMPVDQVDVEYRGPAAFQ